MSRRSSSVLSQDFSNSNIRANRDVGSRHIVRSETTNSHNDYSVKQHTEGDHYSGKVDQGDRFSGEFNSSVLGGQNNENQVNNTSATGTDSEEELLEKRRILLEKVEKKRQQKQQQKQQRLEALQAEVAALKAELEAD